MSTNVETPKAVVQRFYAAIGAWDEEGLRLVLHEDAELHQPPTLPYGRIYRGPDEMMELWQSTILKLHDPDSFVLECMAEDGEHVVVIATATMQGKPVAATEQYTVRDGRIARIRMFWYDPNPVAEAVAALNTDSS